MFGKLANHIALIVFLIGGFVKTYALVEPPALLRACLNSNDSTVTIEYRNPTDACGSFVKYHIYGKESGPSYGFLASQSSFAATSVKIKLPNANPTWSFYFEALFLCNGTDSVKSPTIFADVNKPPANEIDSVSVDITSQTLVVGWTKNAAADVKGYRIYQNNSGINSALGDTESLSYTVSGHQVSNPISITLAAYDSCSLFSTISPKHSPMVLNQSYDPCTKAISYNWSAYGGWITRDYSIYISLNNSPLNPFINNINSTNVGVKVNPGDSVCAFVRSYKMSSTFTSSSNLICFKVPNIVIPKDVYLSTASINEDKTVEVQLFIDNVGTTDSAVLFRVNGATNNVIARYKLVTGINNFTYLDNVSGASGPHQYQAITTAPCLGQTFISNSGTTILTSLNEDQTTLTWTPYGEWAGGVEYYEVWGFDGSTWNFIWQGSELKHQLSESDNTCFRVIGYESKNQYGWSQTSSSNVVCIKKEPTFYVPNALNAAGSNHTFRVIGTSLDLEKSSYTLFDRWGGTIYQSHNVSAGWSINDEGKDVPSGVYFYLLSIVDLNGNKHKSSGSFRVFR